jgi:hypothetical protein
MMISLVVALVVTLFKNHLPDLNMDHLRQDCTVDDTQRETLVSSASDAAQDFYLHMILLVLPSLMTTTAPGLCNFLLLHAG